MNSKSIVTLASTVSVVECTCCAIHVHENFCNKNAWKKYFLLIVLFLLQLRNTVQCFIIRHKRVDNYSFTKMLFNILTTYFCMSNNACLWQYFCHVFERIINSPIAFLNKKYFRNIYAPHGAKFMFIFSIEAKPVRSN